MFFHCAPNVAMPSADIRSTTLEGGSEGAMTGGGGGAAAGACAAARSELMNGTAANAAHATIRRISLLRISRLLQPCAHICARASRNLSAPMNRCRRHLEDKLQEESWLDPVAQARSQV